MNWVISSRDSRKSYDFGGTPSSLINGLTASGIPAEGLNLYPWWMEFIFKNCWRLCRILLIRKPLGFQYSKFANNLRRGILRTALSHNDKVISFHQIVPQISNRFIIYTDCSIDYLFKNYPETFRVPIDIKKISFRLEKDSYLRAELIFLKTLDAIDDLHNNYGIPLDKLKYLPVPPNIRINLNEGILRSRIESFSEKINFVFIGKDAQRKGLDRALDVVRFLQKNGISCGLDVVGVPSGLFDISDLECVVFHGFIAANSPKFTSILEKAHFGFLLSRGEAAGISVREFQAAGIIPIVSDIPSILQGIVVRNFLVAQGNLFDITFYKGILSFLKSSQLRIALEEAFLDAHLISNWQQTGKLIEDSF